MVLLVISSNYLWGTDFWSHEGFDISVICNESLKLAFTFLLFLIAIVAMDVMTCFNDGSVFPCLSVHGCMHTCSTIPSFLIVHMQYCNYKISVQLTFVYPADTPHLQTTHHSWTSLSVLSYPKNNGQHPWDDTGTHIIASLPIYDNWNRQQVALFDEESESLHA